MKQVNSIKVDEFKKNFGIKLRGLRTERGYTLAYVGECTGLLRQNIYKYEKGIDFPQIHHLIALAELFDTTPSELIKL